MTGKYASNDSRIFHIVSTDRTWELMASTTTEASDWVQQLRQAMVISSSTSPTILKKERSGKLFVVDDDDQDDE